MALETFYFPNHTVETENPESSVRGQFGGSYIFTAPPSDPDQRIFTLTFATMQFFLDDDDDLDTTVNVEYNMKTLIDFYHRHKTHASFQYTHPVHGILEVKFFKPLKEPKGLVNGNGTVEQFSVQFIEIP